MRYQRQHQYHTLYLTATAVIFSFALTRKELVGLLLVVPVIAYVLLGRMTAQHFADLQIGTYIASELSPRVPGGLAWEDWTRRHKRPGRWLNWLLPLLLTFPGGGTVALAWTYRYVFTDASVVGRTGLIALWLLDAIAVGACCYLIYRQRRPQEA